MAKNQELLIKINGSAKNFTDEIEKAQKKTKDLEKTLGTVARVSTAAFVALAGAVAGTVARFSSFEKEFSNVITLLDKGSFGTKNFQKGVEGLQDGIIALRASSGESFEALNKGLFDIISATGDAENAMSVLESATKLAIAGGTDVSVAVDGITTSIKAFGLETSDAQSVAEKFFQAQKGGKTTVEELSASIGVAAATANAYNVSLDELLAASSAATLAGIKTSSTFTGLKAVFAGISKPTEEAKKEAERLGISFTSTALRAQGLNGFLKSLTEANGFTQTSVEKLFGSVEAQNIMFALTGQQAGDFASQLKLLGDEQNSAATFVDAYNTKQETTDKAMARLTGSLDALAVTFGAQFAPAINTAADALGAIASGFSKMDKDTVSLIAKITALVTGLVGLVSALSIGTLAFLKIRAGLIAFNNATRIGVIISKAYRAGLLLTSGAIKVFRAGMTFATASVRGFAAATGIGLVLVALSLMVTHFKEVKAVASGTFAALLTIGNNFTKAFSDGLKGISELLIGIFTLDIDKVKAGFAQLTAGAVAGARDLGAQAGTAYREAYDQSIKESESDDALESGADPELEQASDPATLAKEEAAAKIAAKEEENQAILGLEDQKNEALAEKDAEKKEAELERERRQGENLAVVKEELQELDDEQRELLDAKDLEQFQNLNLSKDNIRREFAQKALSDRLNERKQFLKDEMKHGKAVAELNQLLRSQEVQLANETGDKLVKLTQSKNNTLKGIGKAAALTQVGIKTAEGAISAYSSLSGIPIVGPALGAAAAGALIAYGAEQASAVMSAQRGGIVPDGQGGARDRVPALLEPGELVVPSALAPDFIQSVGRPDASGGGSSQGVDVVIGFRDEAFEIIEEKLIERRRIDGVGLGALG